MNRYSLAVAVTFAIFPAALPAAEQPAPTKEFEVRDGLPYLGGQQVKLWGLRCNNALLSPAVTERLVNNLDNMTAHGINLFSVCLQGTNGGFPDVDAGPNGYTPDGRVIPAFARRLEWLVREADKRGMVVCVGLIQPRKDELLRDEAAVRRAIENTARLLAERRLKNVFVNLYQEFDHPLRVDHEIFREPDSAAKKAKLAGWFKAFAPDIELGISPNHTTLSPADFPGCEIRYFHRAMSIPRQGFAVNTETVDLDMLGNEGVVNAYHLDAMRKELESYRNAPQAAMLFRSPYVESVRGKQGTGPNFEMGGNGTSEKDRGIRFFYEWLRTNVGRWQYPRHVKQ